MKNKNILITGGFGNLGSWLSTFFIHAGFKVYVLSKSERPSLKGLNYTFIPCDITGFSQVKQSLREVEVDYVIHAAAAADNFIPGYSRASVLVNALGTKNLLEVLSSKDLKLFVYLSTFQVYGTYEGKVTEETAPAPVNDYGISKLFGEYYVKKFSANNALPHLILRLTNSYGCPKEVNSSKWYLIVNDLSRQASFNKKIVLRSSGLAIRDFIWMGDVCDVIYKLLDKKEAHNQTFNLSGEQIFSLLDIAGFVKQAYQEKYGRSLPISTNTDDLNVYPQSLYVSAAKLRSFVGYEIHDKFADEARAIFQLLADARI